ncbi:unnamed protein product [Hydatigera taeniaeformis]|uniref:SCP domain-containing protein n=1 Tax=Hydatigena taeniaeformis TaxID=6205 RepID=A0A0R3WTZ3_HYDTA|nr:unnamed protein product [Hydatigera taeniaeformis]
MHLSLSLFHIALVTSLSEALSSEDREMLTFLHVSARLSVKPPAINMHPLLWSTELENLARTWAEKCLWGFPDPTIPDEKPLLYVGINVAMISTDELQGDKAPLPPVSILFNLWYVNTQNYDYELNICKGGYCSQYRQIIWAATEQLGCERAICGKGAKRHVLVCCYYPPGNYSELRPYQVLESEDDFPLDEEPWIMRPARIQNTTTKKNIGLSVIVANFELVLISSLVLMVI